MTSTVAHRPGWRILGGYRGKFNCTGMIILISDTVTMTILACWRSSWYSRFHPENVIPQHSPHISPMDAKITPDLCFQRVLATESIAVTRVEGQIGRSADLHGASRPKGCVQGWTQ